MTQLPRHGPSPDPMDEATLYGRLLDGTRRRVLVAEDDFEMRRLLVQTLQRDGFEVAAVSDGAALLDSVRAQVDAAGAADPFDLVVTDDRMPGWSGLDAVEVLRGYSCTTPVLLVTAFANGDVHRRARRLDALVLDKPVDLQELSRAVFELLSMEASWGDAPGFDDDEDDEDPTWDAWGPVRRRVHPRLA